MTRVVDNKAPGVLSYAVPPFIGPGKRHKTMLRIRLDAGMFYIENRTGENRWSTVGMSKNMGEVYTKLHQMNVQASQQQRAMNQKLAMPGLRMN